MKKKIFAVVVLLIILVPLSILLFRKNNVISLSEAKTLCETPNSHYFVFNGQQFHYTERGQGNEVILMVHGFGGSHKNFEVAAELLSMNYKVICVDLPGFGLSEVPNGDVQPESMFDIYKEFMLTCFSEFNIDSCHLVGNSMGGWISWELASTQDPRVKSLTLLNSAGYGLDKVKSNASSWMTGPLSKFIFKKGVPLKMIQANASRVMWDDSKINQDKVVQNYYMMNKEGGFDWMLKMVAAPILPDTTLITQITCPTLIVWGNQDEIVPVEHADKFERDIKGSKKIVYENCGHVPQIEYPQQFAEDLQSFISSI